MLLFKTEEMIKRKTIAQIGLYIGKNILVAAASVKEKRRAVELQTIDYQTNEAQQAFNQLYRHFSNISKKVVIAFSSEKMHLKEVRLDNSLSFEEVYQHSRQQASNWFGQSPGGWRVDTEWMFWLPEIKQQKAWRIFAAPALQINHFSKFLRKSGFSLLAVEIEITALARSLQFLEHYQPNQPHAGIWLQHDTLIFFVELKKQVIYSKKYPLSTQIKPIITTALQTYENSFPQFNICFNFYFGEKFILPADKIALGLGAYGD